MTDSIIFNADAHILWQSFKEEMKRFWVESAGSSVLILQAVFIDLAVILFIYATSSFKVLHINPNFILIAFSMLMLVSAKTCTKKMLVSKELRSIVALPIEQNMLSRGKLRTVFLYNFIFFIIFMLIVVLPFVQIQWYIILGFLFMFLLSALLGFTLSISVHSKSSLGVFICMVLTCITLAPFLIFPQGVILYIFPILPLLITSLLFLLVEERFTEAWMNCQLSKGRKHKIRAKVLNGLRIFLRGKIVSEEEDCILEKEIISLAYKSNTLLIVLMPLLISTVFVALSAKIADAIPPLLFLNPMIQCGFLGITSFGTEGKALWILKSSPVNTESVVSGKSIAILFISIPTTITILLFLSIAGDITLQQTIFYLIQEIALVLAFTGISVYAGASMPNFDKSSMVDSGAFLFVTLLGMLTGVMFFGIPMMCQIIMRFFSEGYGIYGAIFGAVICIIISIFIYGGGIVEGAKKFDKIEIDSYG